MSDDWKSKLFRDNVVLKLNDKIAAIGLENNINNKVNAAQMEQKIFQKATTRNEYLAYIAKLIVYLKEKSKNSTEIDMLVDEKPIDFKQLDLMQKKETTTAPNLGKPVSNFNEQRVQPNDMQKLHIHKTAIASVIHGSNWQQQTATINSDLELFGHYVALKLNAIQNEEQLVMIQQKILSLIN